MYQRKGILLSMTICAEYPCYRYLAMCFFFSCNSELYQGSHGPENAIFAQRNIVLKCIEWNASLFVNFVDRKAFVSIHRNTLLAVMRHYDLSQQIISLIKLFYERFDCRVILKESVSDLSMSKQIYNKDACSFSPAYPCFHRLWHENSKWWITLRQWSH